MSVNNVFHEHPLGAQSDSLGGAVLHVARRITLCLTQWLKDLVERIVACFQRTVVDSPLPSQPLASVVLLPEMNLEEKWKDLVITEVDIQAEIDFEDFLSPNEFGVIGIKPILDKAEPGLLVSTGTERSFFDLALSDPKKCTGLIVRDINPRVKAYVDFNTMLLRIAKDRADYEALSSYTDVISPRMTLLSERLETSEMPLEMKAYYQRHLSDFAEIYFSQQNWWRAPDSQKDFKGVQYHKEEHLFKVLQEFAKSGKIIATIGEMNTLSFLKEQQVGVVDVSNIPDYSFIDLGENLSAKTTVVWTCPATRHGMKTSYYSSLVPRSLSAEQKREFDQLISEFNKAYGSFRRPLEVTNVLARSQAELLVSYSLQLLDLLRDHKTKYLRDIAGIGWISLEPTLFLWNWFKNTSMESLQGTLDNPVWQEFVPLLMKSSVKIDKEKFLLFKNVPGWKEAFLKELSKNNPYFKQKFAEYIATLSG